MADKPVVAVPLQIDQFRVGQELMLYEDLPEPTPTVDAYDDGRSAALWDLVQTLPRRARAVVVLRFYADLSVRDVAELMGCAEGTVKSLTSQAIDGLRRAGLAVDEEDRGAGRGPVDEEEARTRG